MKLRTLVVEGDKKKEKLNNGIPINWIFHHISEIFMEYLPLIEIDGSSKITILARPRPFEEEKYMCYKDFGVSSYYINGAEVKELIDEPSDEYLLHIIEESLVHIAELHHCDSSIIVTIRETATKIRRENYIVKKKIRGLSKKSPDGQFKVDIYRCLGREVGEVWYAEVIKNKVVIKTECLTKKPAFLNRTEFFKKLVWDNKEILIMDGLNKIVKRIAIGVIKI